MNVSIFEFNINGDIFDFSKSTHSDGILTFRSSLPELFCEESLLKNLVKFTGKHKNSRNFLEYYSYRTHPRDSFCSS